LLFRRKRLVDAQVMRRHDLEREAAEHVTTATPSPLKNSQPLTPRRWSVSLEAKRQEFAEV
jgi:hypothetical protein